MNRRQKFQERRRQRKRKSVHRLLFSIFLVLAASFIYENMNVDTVFKGIIANNDSEVTQEPAERVSSVVKINGPVALEEKFAQSNVLPRTEAMLEKNRQHLFIGENYKNMKIESELEDSMEGLEKETETARSDSEAEKQDIQAENDERPIVYLTFDDGPNQFSEQLLALLDSYQAKATFFLIDGNIHLYPEAVEKMLADGHSLGLHSVTHDVKRFYASADSVIAEMDQVRETIKEVAGVETMLIRTPYGSVPHMKDSYMQAVYENGYMMWDWNIDSKDWYYRDRRYVDTCIAQIEAFKGRKEPLVILLHEREETLAHLPALLDYLQKENYIMKALDSSMEPVAFR